MMMTLDEYQQAAMTTWNTTPGGQSVMFNALLGIGGEVGELQDAMKKYYFHGRAEKWDEAVEELGDVLYYAAVLADCMNVTLGSVAEANVAKLAARHPNGWNPSYHDLQATKEGSKEDEQA